MNNKNLDVFKLEKCFPTLIRLVSLQSHATICLPISITTITTSSRFVNNTEIRSAALCQTIAMPKITDSSSQKTLNLVKP
jgi:hypothetical protein